MEIQIQEGESFAVFWAVPICRVIVRLAANNTDSVTAIRIEELSSAVPLLTLSLGERAGVRVSVNANSTETSGNLKFGPQEFDSQPTKVRLSGFI
jgi:hypothetical protein